MIATQTDAKAVGSLAMAHFFIGLLKADAGLSKAEKEKIKILIHKMRHGLPGDHELTMDFVDNLASDADYNSWEPQAHLSEALVHFDAFRQTREYKHDHLDNITEMLEIIMEVGDITTGEKVYIDRVNEEFSQRRDS